MLKNIVLYLFISITTLSFGQRQASTPPNYNLLRRVITDVQSEFYYPRIMDRFMANDTTLSNEQVRALYYGYTLQKEYKPYYRAPQDSLLATYARKAGKNPDDCDTIIRLAKQSLHDFPLDLYKLNLLAYTYHSVGQKDLARIYSVKAKQIAAAIFSTGNGRSQMTGWHVISVSDEYEIIYLLGLFPIDQRFVYSESDFISVAENQLKVRGFYFNIKRLLDVGGALPTTAK